MNFIQPAFFWLLGLLPIIVAMYLLKLRREEQVVPSVYLWQRMVREMEANAPWQRLRRNLLLFLQLLFLLFLIFALARPYTYEEGPAGESLILVIDTSASMAASDTAPSRLEAAKAQARRLVADQPDSVRVTVIAAGLRARVLAPSSLDRRQVFSAIESLQPEMASADLVSALQLASAAASREPDTRIIILSDGGASLPQLLNLKGYISYLPAGVSDQNQGVSLLTLTLAPGGESLTAFVQVSNYAGSPASRRLSFFVDGSLFKAYDLEIPAQGQQAVLVEGLDPALGFVEARLAEGDSLTLDDRAWAVPPQTRPVPVALVSEGNLFLETALSLFPGIELARLRPADLARDWTTSELQPELFILDAYTPVTATQTLDFATLPGGLFFIGPYSVPEANGVPLFSIQGLVEFPGLIPADPNDPLLRSISFEEVSVQDAAAIPLPTWAAAHLYADENQQYPLLFTGEPGGRRVGVLTFDLRHSDLPLNVAFPLLLANLLNWYVPGQGGPVPTSLAVGAPLEIPALLTGVRTIEVTGPSGQATRLPVEAGQALLPGAQTTQPGIYTVRWVSGGPAAEDLTATFAVNFNLPEESNIRPAVSLGVESPETTRVHTGPDQAAQELARREWWRWLAWLALAVLLAEWLVYHRGTIVGLLRRRSTAPTQQGRGQLAAKNTRFNR